nr:MAG TPA: hypothetical protein [Bacteriophage sp.]
MRFLTWLPPTTELAPIFTTLVCRCWQPDQR